MCYCCKGQSDYTFGPLCPRCFAAGCSQAGDAPCQAIRQRKSDQAWQKIMDQLTALCKPKERQ